MNKSNKKEVPATVHFQQTGELHPLDYNWVHILKTSLDALSNDLKYVILPVMEKQFSKHNKLRLIKDDKTSPLGIVLKNDRTALKKYHPYAAIRMDAEELAKYAAEQFDKLDEQTINRMLAEIQ